MALISCPECDHQISDLAPTCPNCGRPIAQPDPVPIEQASAGDGSTNRKRRRAGVVIFLTVGVLAILGILFGTGQLSAGKVKNTALNFGFLPSPTPIPCSVQAKEFVIIAYAQLDDWDDANNLANQTSRIALAPQIAKLQEIR